ncbi:response regulator [Actinomyces oricola]|uniref:response regulator n=1 Tax=Actinomyces oricola TaxID=206043 RepID=UPI000FFE61F0|nr:response regulator transcription factor [Actinomyces oricola]
MEKRIRVLIVDDQTLLRRSLTTILESSGGIEVVGESGCGADAIKDALQFKPDVILMDIRMPGEIDGVEATRRIHSHPSLAGTKVCMLTVFNEDQKVIQALRNGAVGYITKDAPPEEVINAVRSLQLGHSVLPSGALSLALVPSPPIHTPTSIKEKLTPRQAEVLTLIATGMSNAEIEAALHITHSTLKSHVAALLKNLDARDRAQLIVAAYEGGLVQPRCSQTTTGKNQP